MNRNVFLACALCMAVVSGVQAKDVQVAQNAADDDQLFYRLKNASKDEGKPKSVAALEVESLKLIQGHKYREAIGKLTLALKEYPNNAGAYANRAHCYRAIGEFDKAVADYRKAETLMPAIKVLVMKAVGDMYLARGRSRIDAGNFQGAISDLLEAEKSPVTAPPALSELAYIALLNHDFERCIDMADRSSGLNSEFTDPLVTKGACLYYVGRYQAAIYTLNTAISIDPNVAGAYINRAAVHVRTKNCAAAKIDAASAISIDQSLADTVQQLISPCR